MKHRMAIWLGCALLLCAGAGRAADKLPSNKWYQGVKGLQEAREFQRQTNADIVVYFARYNQSDEQGLCRWLEKRGLYQPDVAKYLRDYIKVLIVMPVSSKDEKEIAGFKFNSCPAVFVVQSEGWPKRCQTFDWSGNRPDLLTPTDLIKLFRANSSAKYQEAEPEKKEKGKEEPAARNP